MQVTGQKVTPLQVKVPDYFFTPLPVKSNYKLLSTCNEVLLLRYLTALQKTSLKGAWLGHVDHLNFGGHQPYLWNN